MISTPGHRVLRRRQRRAPPAWFASGRAQPLFETIPLTLSAAAHPVARARWRRCFAFSLAFRLLARIALLGLAVFIPRAPILMKSAHSYRVLFASGKAGVELGVAQSRIPLFPKPTNSASLRNGAPYSVPSQRLIGKHRTPPFVPYRSKGHKGPRRSRPMGGSAKAHPQSAEVAQRRHGAAIARERAQSAATDISLTAGPYDQSGLGVTGPALGQARVGSGVESFPQPGAAPFPARAYARARSRGKNVSGALAPTGFLEPP
jgi:hypothetical protein